MIINELIDGILLSDGYLSHGIGNSTFRITQKTEHLDWIENIKLRLNNIDIRTSKSIKTNENQLVQFPNGKYRVRSSIELWTTRYGILTDQRLRWYPNGIKCVPQDLILSPRVLADWFMGDGTSHWTHKNLSQITFCTECFSESDVEKLIYLLEILQFSPIKINRKSGKRISLSKAKDVIRFFDITKNYIVESFLYKIKYPNLMEKAEKSEIFSEVARSRNRNKFGRFI